jgi:hypothetical protein
VVGRRRSRLIAKRLNVRMRRQHLLITTANGRFAQFSTISEVHRQAGIAAMNRCVAVVFGVVLVARATTASGQEQNPQLPGIGQVTAPGLTGIVSGRDDRQSRPLFTLGGLGVRVWAPLEPHYNAEANRNLAGESIGGAG